MEDLKKLSLMGIVSRYRKELMGVCALMIFFFHLWIPIFSYIPVLGKIERAIHTYAFVGVDVFFFLSGAGLVHSMEKSTVREFYAKRAKRVYTPFFIFYLVLSLIMKYPFTTFLKYVSGYSFFEYAYSVLWFVPAIIMLYILFPPYYAINKKSKAPFLVFIITFVIWIVTANLLPFASTRVDLYSLINRIPVFMLGILFSFIEKSGKFIKSRLWYLLLIPIWGCGVISGYYYMNNESTFPVPFPNNFIPTTLMALGIVFSLSALLYAFEKSKHLKFVMKGFGVPLRFYGGISLEAYIVYWLYEVGAIKVETASGIGNNIINLAIITGLGTVLYYLSDAVNKGITKLYGKIRKNK